MAETVVGLRSVRSRDLDPADRLKAANRIHDVEAVNRTHQFRVSGFHFLPMAQRNRYFIRIANLISLAAETVNPF